MGVKPVRPDYDGAWVGAIVPAALGGGDPSCLPAPARDCSGIVLLVLDGLGWDAVQDHRDRLPVLSAMAGGPVTTVFPSTTASALTSITTGLPPAEHGLIGFRMRVGGRVLSTLQWRLVGEGAPPAPEQVQPHPPFLGRQVSVVTRTEFSDGGFSQAHLRGARSFGWQTPAVLVHQCGRLARERAPFVYAYYDGVDKVAHAHGLSDGFYTAELSAADRLAGDLLATLPPDYALVVSSDHGQVEVAGDDHRDLDSLRPLIAAVSGEARFRCLYARPGASADLLAGARERFAEEAWVFTRQQLSDEGWLGARVGASVAGRVGDVVLAARGSYAFVDPSMPHEGTMRSMHGSLTAEEMLVPLLAARGIG